MSPLALLALYIVFRLKQFICDFILQSDWMALSKGQAGAEGRRALFWHVVTHGAATFVIMMAFAPSLWWLGLADMAIHALIDRTKGIVTARRGWTVRDRLYWWSFGVDQEAHNFTHLAYIVLIVLANGGIIL